MAVKTVQAWLDDIRLLYPERHALVTAIHERIIDAAPRATVEVKYGGLLFGSPMPFCGIFVHRAHVSVEFSHGALIEDSAGLLQGAGKYRRHLKLTSTGDVDEKRLADHVLLALAAADSQR